MDTREHIDEHCGLGPTAKLCSTMNMVFAQC